jgi:hypothetical protein
MSAATIRAEEAVMRFVRASGPPDEVSGGGAQSDAGARVSWVPHR